ncbi:MAG: HEPN domain-containing protein [Saprospiraceae bacterium]
MNPDDPFAWLAKGDRDFALVRDMSPNWEAYPDLICYHCQQAAEKYLKALLLHVGQPIKRTHDLEEVLDLLAAAGLPVSAEHFNHAVIINDYAVLTRYPSLAHDPSEADVFEAIGSAEFFRTFVLGIVTSTEI